jgi:hypothetical protein
MVFSPERLLKELDQPNPIEWSLELNYRKEAYAYLQAAVRANDLNPNQFRDALHALLLIAFPENVAGVLETFFDVSRSADIVIRSEAVRLALGIVRLSRKLREPVVLSQAQELALGDAMANGLTPHVADVANEYFAS